MPTPALSDELKRQALEAAAHFPTKKEAASSIGLNTRTFEHRLRAAQAFPPKSVEIPELHIDEEHEPIEDIIDRMARNYARAKKAADARQWFTVKINDDKPIGLLCVGDPHVDDNGCNWPALKRHAELCRETPGLYAMNIGDSANFWGGRLMKKYADQDASVHTARRLVEWLMLNSGFNWLLWLIGNHEHMGDAAPLLHEMNKRFGTQRIPMLDWEARFVLQFPNGEQFRINAAHNFAGNSMWNPLHGPVKVAKFGDNLDLVVCGDKHNWAIAQWEQAEQGNSPLMVRCRGYKHLDDYARRLGKYEQEDGQSVLVILNQNAKTKSGRTMAFADVEAGADYLKWLRR